MRPRSLAIVAASLALGAGGVLGCGSSAPSAASSSPGSASSSASASGSSSTAGARSPHVVVPVMRRLERALRHARATPPASAASCRRETAAQRSGSPFGSTGPPVYACLLARGGQTALYDVQLLATGCFVAERRAPGVAIYGCGAGRS